MITSEYCRLMARYNEWTNTRLYAQCAAMPEPELRRDRGAFFGSIYLTLNHIVYGDLAWLSRLTGVPAVVPEPGVELFDGFAELRSARRALDARLIEWSATLTSRWLEEPLTYSSKIDGKNRTIPKWVMVTHMLNHQTHHRGQITTLLSQMDLDINGTDIVFMPEFQPAAER